MLRRRMVERAPPCCGRVKVPPWGTLRYAERVVYCFMNTSVPEEVDESEEGTEVSLRVKKFIAIN